MNKSLKKFLILTQVLGLSALAVTACTDNNASQTKTTSVETKTETKTQSPEPIKKPDPAKDLKNSKHHLKPETVKKIAKGAKLVADTGIVAGAVGVAISNPAAAAKIIKTGVKAVKTVNKVIDNKAEKEVAKAKANEQAEAQAQAQVQAQEQSESQEHDSSSANQAKGEHHGTGSKLKNLADKLLHPGKKTSEKPNP